MRAAFWVGCAALLLSACSSEPVQQATAAHVAPGLKASMSSSGEANCAMIGGSLSVALGQRPKNKKNRLKRGTN